MASTRFQSSVSEVISLLYHRPPDTPAPHSLFELDGSINKARVLPPILFGPLSSQLTSVNLLEYLEPLILLSATDIPSINLSFGIS